jgi:transcriptional regulator with XRE-family HTH domain
MSAKRLPNYLRMYRKRAGLSQEELARLLGCRTGTKVSRYEHFKREPTLRTALAYEAVFRIPVRELFAGLGDVAERDVAMHARRLARVLKARHNAKHVAQKLGALETASAPSVVDLVYEPFDEAP